MAAMLLFWSRGYEATSVGDLAESMGINKPSLYSTFGSKEALFREALALYEEVEGVPIQRLLDQASTAREAVAAALLHNARAYTSPDKPRGCMTVLSSLLGTVENEEVRELLANSRRAGEAALGRRIARGIEDGDVPARAPIDKLAAFYTTVTQGMSVQARDGATFEGLAVIVDSAMLAWDALTSGERRAAARRPGAPARRGRLVGTRLPR